MPSIVRTLSTVIMNGEVTSRTGSGIARSIVVTSSSIAAIHGSSSLPAVTASSARSAEPLTIGTSM